MIVYCQDASDLKLWVAIPTMGLAAKFDNSESSLSSFASGNGYVSFCVSDAEVIQAKFVEDSRSGGAILRVLLDIISNMFDAT